jgi:predicted ferric reductase
MTPRARPPAAHSSSRRSRLSSAGIRAFFLANAALVVTLWVRHGGLSQPASLSRGLVVVGQLSALVGTYMALVALLLVARTPLVEHLLGDRGTRYHRLAGFSAIVLIGLHVSFSVAGFAVADGASLADEFTTEVVNYPYMLAALAGLVIFLVIGMSSMRFIRSRISYETWTGIHLYAYLAIILAFGHQLAVGSDFSSHPLSRVYWFGLYGAVFGIIARYRFAAPLVLLLRHRFRVSRVVVEAPGVVSIYVGGRNLDRLDARAGQYFRLRLLARNEWWRAHPFSISAMPDGRSLRFTVKSLGDFSERIQGARTGTRVMLEGPYGALTSARRKARGVALIGGGIGVTPIRALFEEFAGHADVKLIYRASRAEDVVFWDELWKLERPPHATVTWLIGRRGSPAMPDDPLSALALDRLVPDIRSRDVFLCGPTPMMDAVERTLDRLGVPRDQVHSERFAA